jgi:hypothetical protein
VDVADYAIEMNERFQRAIASVDGPVQGLPHDVAVERLRDAMRRQDVFMSPDVVRRAARQLSDPWRPVRHPVMAWREVRARAADTEGVRLETEASELSRRVEVVADETGFDWCSIQSRRTVDGQEHVVLIEPWSASRAKRIVKAAAPIPVQVRPRTAG